MTIYKAPPDQTNLTLENGDVLYVNAGGMATGTIINSGGTEEVEPKGHAIGTTIHAGGIEFVLGGTATNTVISNGGTQNVTSVEYFKGFATGTVVTAGGTENVERSATDSNTLISSGGTENVETNGMSINATISAGGTENVQEHGRSTGTTILAGGVENVGFDSRATDTTISGGIEHVEDVGTADNVRFLGSHSTLELARPSGLIGTISGWHVGDVIDFLNTTVTGVHETGNTLTVSYGGQTASYTLAGQEANTEFKLQSDGHGGMDLILTPVVGVQHLHESGHLVMA